MEVCKYDIYDAELDRVILENETLEAASAIMHGLAIECEMLNLKLIERGVK